MNHLKIKIIVFLLLGCSYWTFSQSIADFNTIEIKNGAQHYEQWLNRDQFKMAQFIMARDTNNKLKYIIPIRVGMPMAKFSQSANKTWKAEPINNEDKIEFKPFKHYFFDFWIQPDFKYQLGNFDKPVETKGGISIYHQMPIAGGLSLFTGLHIPITNDYDEQPKQLRPAASYLNYFKSLGKFNYIQGSIGYFLGDRYGYKLSYQKADLNANITWGLENSMTGYLYFFPKKLKYTSISDFILLANVAYRIRKNDTSIKLTAGQFLYKDIGAKLELIKQFSKAEISLFALASKNGSTVGLELAFRLPPGKIFQKNRFRLRTGSEFPFLYYYSRGYGIAENFNLLTDLERSLRQFNTSYLNNESVRHLK